MKKWAYYNDNEPTACAWLRELIKNGLITDGEVDCRSIVDVRPDDVRGFRRVHLFAGIGGWDYALQLAGWPDDEPVWTASFPCQPFSAAGLQMGTDDTRHLFPTGRKLIARCNPATVIGEQVASKLGREWLARVRVEMATLGYAVTASDLCAAGAGAPHIRQRLYWCATGERKLRVGHHHEFEDGTTITRMEHSPGPGCERGVSKSHKGWARSESGCSVDGLAHPHEPRPQGRCIRGNNTSERSAWANSVGVPGKSGITRRLEPGIPPVAPRIPARVALIRGSGNSIVPQIAAKFIEAAFSNRGSGLGLIEDFD